MTSSQPTPPKRRRNSVDTNAGNEETGIRPSSLPPSSLPPSSPPAPFTDDEPEDYDEEIRADTDGEGEDLFGEEMLE